MMVYKNSEKRNNKILLQKIISVYGIKVTHTIRLVTMTSILVFKHIFFLLQYKFL